MYEGGKAACISPNQWGDATTDAAYEILVWLCHAPRCVSNGIPSSATASGGDPTETLLLSCCTHSRVVLLARGAHTRRACCRRVVSSILAQIFKKKKTILYQDCSSERAEQLTVPRSVVPGCLDFRPPRLACYFAYCVLCHRPVSSFVS